jgi:transposase InsO family protein
VREWLSRVSVQTLLIEPGSPWENGYVESFNSKLRDELLDREIFYTLIEAQVLVQRWRRDYNWRRPYSARNWLIITMINEANNDAKASLTII